MGQWSREELEEAWRRYQEAVVQVGKTWDWSSYADHFTEDAKYVEHSPRMRSTSSTPWATWKGEKTSGGGSSHK